MSTPDLPSLPPAPAGADNARAPELRSGDGFGWIDSQRTKGFATWADEIAHVEAQGYALVPPDYHIPHWSQADAAPKIYANWRDGVREIKVAFNREARDLGYPIYFKPNK